MIRSRLLLLALVGSSTCSQKNAPTTKPASSSPALPAPAAVARGPFFLSTQGNPFDLRFEGGALLFCDGRGRSRLDLRTRATAANGAHCAAPAEANGACDGLSIDATVRAPITEPNDIVDLDGWSAPMDGHVRDCAAAGKTLGIATGSTVVLVDVAKEAVKVVSHEGADRIGIGDGWIAWSRGPRIDLAPIDAR